MTTASAPTVRRTKNMPFASNEELPDVVKNAIPEDAAQLIWRNAFNSAIEKTPEDEGAAAKLAWGAVKNAGWNATDDGKWIKATVNDDLFKYADGDLNEDFAGEMFSVGKWKGDEYSLEDMHNFA